MSPQIGVVFVFICVRQGQQMRRRQTFWGAAAATTATSATTATKDWKLNKWKRIHSCNRTWRLCGAKKELVRLPVAPPT